VESFSPEETERMAAALAAELRPGDVVNVSGELGSGKTTFVRGAARALGVEAPVTSPTYTIGHLYEGRVPVAHLDLYRFNGMADAEWGDLESYFEETVAFVEWPEAGAGFLPPARAGVGLRHLSERHRLIVLASPEKALENSVLTGVGPRI
jgi:tRNA threonylcarbamoyladenosine biosynthesis protein TsaE